MHGTRTAASWDWESRARGGAGGNWLDSIQSSVAAGFRLHGEFYLRAEMRGRCERERSKVRIVCVGVQRNKEAHTLDESQTAS